MDGTMLLLVAAASLLAEPQLCAFPQMESCMDP
jgi:hypothetical protein